MPMLVYCLSSNREDWEEMDHCREKRKVYEPYETRLISSILKSYFKELVRRFIPIGPYDTRKLQGSHNPKLGNRKL